MIKVQRPAPGDGFRFVLVGPDGEVGSLRIDEAEGMLALAAMLRATATGARVTLPPLPVYDCSVPQRSYDLPRTRAGNV